MRLTTPTDFEILEALADGKRNNAINLAVLTEKNKDYINTRLPVLADYGLVEKVGPVSNSGLYVITERGQAALALRDVYEHTIDFESQIDSHLS